MFVCLIYILLNATRQIYMYKEKSPGLGHYVHFDSPGKDKLHK
jgi:hypothetical protein